MSGKIDGARPSDQALAVPATPAGAVDGPSGFDPSRVDQAIRKLTPAQIRNLLALPWHPEAWATVSEMRHKGATGSGMDILCVYHDREFSVRRWAKWGGEFGQQRVEGYEYAITPFGAAVRDAIAIEAATAGETAQHGSTEGKSASPQDIAQIQSGDPS